MGWCAALVSSMIPLGLPAAAHAGQAGGPAASGQGGEQVGAIVVSIRSAGGATLETLTTVNVYTQYHQLYSSGTAGSGSIRYEGVPLGTYIVEASAPGYIPAEENIELMVRNEQRNVSFAMLPVGDPSAKPVANKPPLLAPKAQKELSKGLEELRANHSDEAKKHLLNALKLAPTNPDVNYLLGVLATKSGDVEQATRYWKKAVAGFPTHTFSLIALGEVCLAAGDLEPAKEYLEKAVTTDPSSWRGHQTLARVFLQRGQYEDSRKEAEKAIALGKTQALASQLVLAKALIGLGNRERAAGALKEFLGANPPEASARSAQKLLAALERANGGEVSGNPTTESSRQEEARADLTPALPPPVKWMPPDVDATIPAAENEASCHLNEILPQLQKNVIRFTSGLDRFTATETIQSQQVSDQGLPQTNYNLTFNYLVSMHEIRPGILNVDEYRNGTMGLDVFPDGIATIGLPSIILIFHPVHREDFEMKCEGLGSSRGIPAWQVHFQQRENRMGVSRAYRVNGVIHHVALKGRAWISRDSLQIVRVETDLVHPVPEIRLNAEHQEIDYGAVPFPKQREDFWLPATTDFYTEFRGKRIHRRLKYSDYVLFSVDEKQKIGAPPEAKATP